MQNSLADLPEAVWHKSRHSGAQGNCVELAGAPTRSVAVRNSRFPDGPALVFAPEEMAGFLADIKAGLFDDLVPGRLP